MSLSFSRRLLGSALLCFSILLGLCVMPAWGQMGSQGSVSVTVLDQTGGTVPGATLTLQDLSTNDVRTAVTPAEGTHTFAGLPLGNYKLTVSKADFKTEVFDLVAVQAARVTDVKVTLIVGAKAEQIEVSVTAIPIIQSTSNAISGTIDLKQIEQLPLGGRDISQMAFLVAGYNGTWDGLPTAAQGNNIDGVIASPSRMKFAGNTYPVLQARLEDMQEMTIQTDQLDLNTGFGQSNMQVNFVTRRGTNNFHGRLYEDHRNAALNANTWLNDASGLPKPPLIMNDFGGSVGGPIIKNKLFFFGSFAMFKQPGAAVVGNPSTSPLLAASAQQGNLTFTDNNGNAQTVNVLTQIAAPNGLPSTINPLVSSQLQAIDSTLASGAVVSTGDPNINYSTWLNNAPITRYFPALRLDYNVKDNLRINFAWNRTKEHYPNTATAAFPGSAFANRIASNKDDQYTASLGVDWTVKPNVINQFRGGFLYNASWFAYDAAPLYDTQPQVNWAIAQSGQWFNLPISTYYPVSNLADNVNWVHGAHTFNLGVSLYREQDHYWNGPAGFPVITLGLNSLDPAFGDFANSPLLANASSAVLSEAQNLYATLVGRISNVTGTYALDPKTKQYFNHVGAYNLDELQKAWGLFIQDSWRLKPTLTLNYGLRWDFTGDDHDLTSGYHSADPVGIWGPSGVGNIFKPGVLTTGPNGLNPVYTAKEHQYNPWNVSPQPALGVAWNPNYSEGLKGKLFGESKTVIRVGTSLRRYTEPYQFFWNSASNYGFAFYQNFSLSAVSPGTATGQGQFVAGSLALGDTLPAYFLTPASYSEVIPESSQTFYGYWSGVNGMMPNIRQPYVMSWNFGIQRAIGQSHVLEVRYSGNRSVHQWIQLDPNEVNIFENGFLKEFQNAQANLAINAAHGASGSFANNGYPGQQALPILTQAGVSFTDGGFIHDLQTGQAGLFAATLAGGNGAGPAYLCNLIGSANFSPCLPYTNNTPVAGAYPINFFTANPFANATNGNQNAIALMTDAGFGNYHALQVDLREKPWHGAQFDVNYTWSHTLGVQPGNTWTGAFNLFTMRDLRLSYGPTLFDYRHVVHANGTYDLPFGKGRRFLNHGRLPDRVVGGWTLGTIVTFQTGAPWQVMGGYLTMNDYGDGGITLSGVTASQLNNSRGVYRTGQTFANGVNPNYLANNGTGGGANTNFINPSGVAGIIGYHPWLYGPHTFYQDMAITKAIPIRENVRFTFQSEFLNVWNHPVWSNPAQYPWVGSSYVQAWNFGEIGVSNGPRNIELRANIEF